MKRRYAVVRTSARSLRAGLVLAALFFLLPTLAAPHASAAFLGKARKAGSPARLVASVFRRGATQTNIWSFDYGTGGSVRLDTNYSPHGKPYNDSPTYSPEGGSHIAYVGKSGPHAHNGDVFVVDRDTPGTKGVHPRNLTASRRLDGDAENPSWSPAGGKLVFDFRPKGATHAQLWWTNLAGALRGPVTCCDGPGVPNGVVLGTDPAWSPNGNWIAFTKHVHVHGVDVKQLWVTSFSGKLPLDALPRGPVQIHLATGQQPNWSPLGGRIAYVDRGSLYVIRFNPLGFAGARPVLIDNPPPGYLDESPAWSPDSYDASHGVLVFDRRPVKDSSTHAKQLYQVNPNGKSRTPRRIDTRHAGFRAGNGDWWPQCTNNKATSDGKTIKGSPGPDLLCGAAGSSTFRGYGGDDRIFAGAGRDTIFAGPGNDYVLAGIGRVGDKVYGGVGDDFIEGSPAADLLVDRGPKSGKDTIVGGGGNDTIRANDGIRGNDRVNGGDGTDTCTVDNRPPGDVPAVDFVWSCEHLSLGRIGLLEVAQLGR